MTARPQLSISAERPDSPEAMELIAELEASLEPLYPSESRHGLSVERLIEARVAFFVLRYDGTPAGCGGVQLFGREYGELKRIPEFDTDLQELLKSLDRWRNMLEHYAIEADRDAILAILRGLRSPLLEVFEEHIPDFKMKSKKLVEKWGKVDLLKLNRRQVIIDQLEKYPTHSNNWIADDTGVSDGTVRTVRSRLEAMGVIPTYEKLVSRNGTEYPRKQRSSKIGGDS
jgi:hypothetical protein